MVSFSPGFSLNLQANFRSRLSPNQSNDSIQLHLDNILKIAIVLTDGGNLVVHLQTPVFLGRAARDDFRNGRHAVLGSQSGTNPLQTESHLDFEIFQRLRRHVARMRIVAMRHGGQEILENFAVFGVVSISFHRVVTLVQSFAGVFNAGLVELQRQQFVLDPLSPAVIHLLEIRRPWQLIAVHHQRLVDREILRCVDQPLGQCHPFVETLQIETKRLVSKTDLSHFNQIVELVAVPGEAINVRLQKVQLLWIEVLNELHQNHRGNSIVERLLADVVFGNHLGDEFDRRLLG